MKKNRAELDYTLIDMQLGDIYPQSLSYMQAYYGAQLKIKSFLQDYHDYISEQYAKTDYKTYETLLDNFPFLGKFTAQHSFHLTPLYRYLNPTEPQFTKALSKFLFENQQSCKAFLQAVFTLLPQKNGELSKLPETGYQCLCEVVTRDVRSKNKKRKRIDNVIMWNNEAVCIEVKFDAVINDNDLKAYEQQMETTAKGKTTTYIAISIDNIQDTIKQKKCDNWKNLRWCDVMRLWEQNILQNNISESGDMKRYRSSLWNKILYWEH